MDQKAHEGVVGAILKIPQNGEMVPTTSRTAFLFSLFADVNVDYAMHAASSIGIR
jgi:hypothetical protein